MHTWVWIIVAIAVVVCVVAVLVAAQQQRRTRLRNTFGPEYDREVEARGNRGQAERELSGRLQRRKQLDIRPLSEEQRDRYSNQWNAVQARFVDAPHDAVQEADTLVTAVMRDRGYPMGDFDQRAADVSVDHAQAIDRYRAAHDISQRSAAGTASTEDLRQAMVHYRALFSELLDSGAGAGDREAYRGGARVQ